MFNVQDITRAGKPTDAPTELAEVCVCVRSLWTNGVSNETGKTKQKPSDSQWAHCQAGQGGEREQTER